jgi:flagellar protein FlaG
METKVATFAATPDPTFGQSQPSAKPPSRGRAAAGPALPDPVDLRLVIEEDQASGSYVYKTVNRRTGEVVQSLPRADILRMRQGANYAAGQVIKTKA